MAVTMKNAIFWDVTPFGPHGVTSHILLLLPLIYPDLRCVCVCARARAHACVGVVIAT
jgi:hypothetical protein